MPIYEYKCECSLEDIVSKERSITDVEPSYLCVLCGKKMHRHYGSFGIQLRVTDFIKQIMLSNLN